MSAAKTIASTIATGALLGLILDITLLIPHPICQKQPFRLEGTFAGATFGFLIGVLLAIIDKTCCFDAINEPQARNSMGQR